MSADSEISLAAAACWLATGPEVDRAFEIAGEFTQPGALGLAYLAALAETRYGKIDGLALASPGVLRVVDESATWDIRRGNVGWLLDNLQQIKRDNGDEVDSVLRRRFRFFGELFGVMVGELRAGCERAVRADEAQEPAVVHLVPTVPDINGDPIEVPTMGDAVGVWPTITPEAWTDYEQMTRRAGWLQRLRRLWR